MSAPRSLITGITGQDGSYLSELLLELGHDVIGLVRPPADRELPHIEVLRSDIELVTADIGDDESLSRAVRAARPDRIYHLAAPTFVPASWDDPSTTMREIVTPSARVLTLAEELDARVLVAASPEIFGDAGVTPQTETSPKRPLTPYGVAKLATHELARVLRDGRGVHACSIITYNHESPRRPERFVTRKITRAAAAIKLGLQDEVVLGDLGAQRDWSHAMDVVRGFALALDHERADDYILASGRARTVRELVEAAFGAAGLDPDRYVRIDPSLVRPAERTPLVGDPSHARDVLGWEPRVSFDAMVVEMLDADLQDLASRRLAG